MIGNQPDQPNRRLRENGRQEEEDEGGEEDGEGKKVNWDQQGGDQAIPERGQILKIHFQV